MTRSSRPTRATRWTLPLAVALVLAVVASGCSQGSSGADAGTPQASASSPTAGDPTPSSKYGTYVALGDSYTAAPLVPATDTSNGCLRSTGNYPSLVAKGLPGTQLIDVSCSGADSSSMVGVQETGSQAQQPQFNALTKGADLVTVGIGGNDFGLFGTLIGTCARLRDSDPTGSPCEAQLSSGGSDQLTRDLRQIRGHVAAIVAGIRDRAPHARVVVVGYPQIVPAHGTCPDLLPLATGDYAYAHRINQGLSDAVRLGARKADDYIDVLKASAGHDICSKDPWINGQATDPARALAFHPFAAEQKAVARLVLAAVS